MRKLNWLGLLLLLAIAGCHRDGRPVVARPVPPVPLAVPAPIPPSPEAPPAIAPPVPEETPTALRATVVPLPEPHHYVVKLAWHEGSAHADAWTIVREDAKLEAKTVAQVEERVREHTDVQVAAGSYRYTLWLRRNGEQFSHGSVNVTVPRDLVISGTVHRSEVVGYQRLYLERDSHLRPEMGKSLRIDVEDLRSDEGTIESFAPDQGAEPRKNGRSGPLLWIAAKKGSGIIHLISRGEHGGSGVNGRPGGNGNRGARGHDAIMQRVFGVGNPMQGPYGIRTMSTPAEVDQLYSDFDRFYGPCHPMFGLIWRCVHPATSGLTGEAGGRGGDAELAGDGGNSSPVYLKIADSSEFEVRFSSEWGSGGHRANAGNPGDGGPGGEPGTQDKYCLCPSTPDPGVAGAKGAPGANGGQGRAGTRSPACFRLGAFTQGECAAFNSEGELLR